MVVRGVQYLAVVKLRIYNFDDADLPLEAQMVKEVFLMPEKPKSGYDKFRAELAKLKLKVINKKYKEEK